VKNYSLKFKILFISFILFGLSSDYFSICKAKNSDINFSVENKKIILNDDGLVFEVQTKAETVDKFFEEQKINLSDNDVIFPEKDSKVYSGIEIDIQRAKKIFVTDGNNKSEIVALGKNVADALWDNKIKLGEDDIIIPKPYFPLGENNKVEIIRVDIQEQKVMKGIDFKKLSEEEDELSWRVSKIKQKGIPGSQEITYRVVSHNGKEISRKIISQNTQSDPVPEITVQGTYMKLGKADNGAASWYNFTGKMTAANPWLPMGSYVKVTNKDNGKSVVVKIVDRGPFGPGRIIDLEKVAFAKIASIGAGVVNVKMEVILN
jgi:uncharacterized protein YabE (DUF348 family)